MNSKQDSHGTPAGGESQDPPLTEEYVPVQPSASDTPEVYGLANAPESWSDQSPVRRVTRRGEPRKSAAGRGGATRILLSCNLLVFLTSVCVMVLELTASRLVAKHIGNSIYTWTSVIGVVLAGITLGNFLGGWLADRYDRIRMLPVLFLVASGLCYSVLWVDRWVDLQERPVDLNWSSWVLLLVVECYLLPSMSLGTISPVLASVALSNSQRRGMTVGSVYAWGAFGSIVGTFLTGFLLIETFGTRTIIGGTALVLAALAVITAAGRPALRVAVLVGWMQWILFTLLVIAATPHMLAQSAFQLLSAWDGQSLQDQFRDLSNEDAQAALAIARRSYSHTLDQTAWEESARLVGETGLGSDGAQPLLVRIAEQMDQRDLLEWMNELVAEGLIKQRPADWLGRGWRVGESLHRIGYTLWLRNDFPGDYQDESRYSAIQVGPADGHDADTLALRLDKLVHAYYSPSDPERLYYEYEQVYAAVTEVALAGRDQQFNLDVKELTSLQSDLESGRVELPEGVQFDVQANRLKIRGGLSDSRRDSLLRLARSGPWWQAVTELQERTARPDWSGFTTYELKRLPDCVEIPEQLSRIIGHDRNFEHVVVYDRIDTDQWRQLIDASTESAYYWRVRALSDRSRSSRTLFLGGGGYVFPRWVAANLGEQTTIDVVEIDPAVEDAVRKRMGLPHPTRTTIHTDIGDARQFVDRWSREAPAQRRSYQLIYGDAFQDFNIPWHLTTREFLTRVRTLMSDDGLFLVNLIDAYPRSVYEGERAETVEREYLGVLPASWKQAVLPKRWVRIPGVPGLDVFFEGEGRSRVRFHRTITDSSLAAAYEVAGTNRSLTELLNSLEAELTRPAPFPGDLPAAWLDAVREVAVWQPVESAPGIELQLLEERSADVTPQLALSFRGRMSLVHYEQLDRDYGSYGRLKQTLDAWYQQPVPRTGRFLGRFVLTATKVFPAVYVFSSSLGAPVSTRDTFVIVAANRRIDWSELSDSPHWTVPPFAAWVQTDDMKEPQLGGQMLSVLGLSEGQVLTDDFAPVDNLLAPVFERQGD